jgi:hypothetical protein
MFVVFVFCLAPADCAAWGKMEIKMEQLAIKFAREVERGGYKIVRTDELKQWVDQKKDMLIVDTMPAEPPCSSKIPPCGRPLWMRRAGPELKENWLCH